VFNADVNRSYFEDEKMNQLCAWSCFGGIVVGLGFLGLFVLLFSPTVSAPFWLFALPSIGLPTGLGLFLGAAFDVVFRNNAPVFAAIGAITGVVAGSYYAINLYRPRASR
jgi:hypothetical protein